MTYEGHTAGTPRAGVVRRASVLTAHVTAWSLSILAVLGGTVSLLSDPPRTFGAIEGVLRNDWLAATLLAAGVAGTALFAYSYMRAFRNATGAAVLFRGMSPSQIAAAITWFVAIAGFVVYLASVDAFRNTYGSVSTGAVLLLWLTLFSLLHYAMPDLHVPGVRGERVRVTPADPPQSPIADRVDLVVAPSAALRNSTAQGRMMSVLGARAGRLSDREVEMMDWGFAFGVAWAVAREQDPAAPEELVSLRALDVTQAVYDAYRGSPAPAQALGR